MKTHEIFAVKDRITRMDDVLVGEGFVARLQDVVHDVTVHIQQARGRVYLAAYRGTDYEISMALYDQLNAAQQKRECAVRRRENNRRQARCVNH